MQPEFSVDFCAGRIPIWENVLEPYKGKPHVRFLEVGSFEGCSACWMLENILTHPTASLVCVDPFLRLPEMRAYEKKLSLQPYHVDSMQERFEKNIRAVGGEEKTTLLRGRSEDVLRALGPGSFDAAYIDGSHAARGVLTDMVLVWHTVKLGGLMIMDDYRLEVFEDARKHPRLGIDAFLSVFLGEYELVQKEPLTVIRKARIPDDLWAEEQA